MRKQAMVALLLGAVLVGTGILPARANELDDAIDKYQDLASQEQQAKEQLKQLTFKADRLKQQIAQLDTQIAAASADLNRKQKAYADAQLRVSQVQDELSQKQKDLEDRRAVLAQRLRGIYVDGQVSYLEVLFQASDLSDFITRLEYLARVVANDQQLLNGIQEQKEQIAQKAEELQARRDEAAKLQVQAAAAKADLDNKKMQQQKALAETKRDQEEQQAEAEKFAADMAAAGELIRQLTAKYARQGTVNGTISVWPLPGYYEISSPFGWRTHPITKKRSLHGGDDIPAPAGTPIKAAGAGVVIYVGWYGVYGNVVMIDHGGGYSTLYAHQSRTAATVGQKVAAGDVIGYVGSTGWSTGNHLHFEVRVNGNPTDPLQFFPSL